jgi:hypothetical protein
LRSLSAARSAGLHSAQRWMVDGKPVGLDE